MELTLLIQLGQVLSDTFGLGAKELLGALALLFVLEKAIRLSPWRWDDLIIDGAGDLIRAAASLIKGKKK
jgi:hypothetical protein